MSEKSKNNISSAELENIQISQNTSFKIGEYENGHFSRPLHYHPEFEILMINKGFGTRMVGDNFEPFEEGDLVLLGGNLPHAWISDSSFIDNNETCASIYIQFQKNIFVSPFIDIPEMRNVQAILKKAERGVKVEGIYKKQIAEMMLQIKEKPSLERLLSLISILDLIFRTENRALASYAYIKEQVHFQSPKMTKVHNYIMQHFQSEVSIEDCANYLKMTPTSFCRFFKKHTQSTFSNYLNTIRIGFAQKLICNTELPIKEVGYECGYTSIVYFNQQFKKLTDVSPNQYRKKYGVI